MFLLQERFQKMLEMQEKFGDGISIVTPSRVGIRHCMRVTKHLQRKLTITGTGKRVFIHNLDVVFFLLGIYNRG
jgi:hypothetical protein